MDEIVKLIAAWDIATWQGIALGAALLAALLGLIARSAMRRAKDGPVDGSGGHLARRRRGGEASRHRL